MIPLSRTTPKATHPKKGSNWFRIRNSMATRAKLIPVSPLLYGLQRRTPTTKGGGHCTSSLHKERRSMLVAYARETQRGHGRTDGRTDGHTYRDTHTHREREERKRAREGSEEEEDEKGFDSPHCKVPRIPVGAEPF